MSQFKSKCIEETSEHGPGMNIFTFLSREKASATHNCDYYYAPQDSEFFQTVIESSPHGEVISKKYDPFSMYLVCVQVPQLNETDYTGSLRMFYTDGGEVEL